MHKIYKRVLTPLFFAVVALVILCSSAFADDVSGIPTISINGGNPTPWISSIIFEDNDEVNVISSGIITFDIVVPDNVTITVNPNVEIIISNYIAIEGIVNNYGTINRSDNISGSSATIVIRDGGVLNQYYGSVIRNNSHMSQNGIAINISSGGTFNFYGGTVIGLTTGIYNPDGSYFNYYSGSVEGLYPITNIDSVNVVDGNIVSDNGVVTVKSDIFGIISDFVSSSVSWISSFVSSIVSSSLLLTFVLMVFVGLGIGLLRRVKSI